MGTINITNSKNRDSIVNTESVRSVLRTRLLDDKGRQASSARLLRATMDRDIDALTKAAGSLSGVADLLVKGDPEVDIEMYGSQLRDTSRVYVNPEGRIVHKVVEWEIVRNPDGTVKERRPRRVMLPNTSTEMPLKWSGKLAKKSDVFNKY